MDSKRKWLLSVLLVLCLVVLVWIFRPVSLSDRVWREGELSAVRIESSVKNGEPLIQSTKHKVDSFSLEGQTVKALLEDYSYHHCLHTVFGSDSIKGAGGLTLSLYGDVGELLLNGGPHVLVDGKVVRLDYIGKRNVKRLMEELLAVIPKQEG